MYLAMLRLEVRIDEPPRTRRKTVQAILDRLHAHFNVSVAEVGELRPGPDSVLAVAAVAATRKEVREVLDRVADAVAAHPRLDVLKLEWTEP